MGRIYNSLGLIVGNGCALNLPTLEAECVVELGAQSLVERRETRVELNSREVRVKLIPSKILPVLCVDEVEVVPGRDDPSRPEKQSNDLRNVIVLNVAGN